MSVPDRRTSSLAGRSESPSRASSSDAVPPEQQVESGEVRFRGEEAQSEKTVRFEEGQLEQLATLLAVRMSAPKARWTLGELASKWLSSVRRVRLQDEQRNVVQLKPLWGLKEDDLTVEKISDWFTQLLAMSFNPISVNKYRCAGRLVIRLAQANGQWGPINPFDLVPRLKEPKRKYETLNLEQLRALVPHLREDHARMVRITVALGLRTGELFALQRGDVEFNTGVVFVRRSHARDTTKTGVNRTLPLLNCIAGDLLDLVREAREANRELLFPGTDGGLRRADTKMSRVLRTALGKAGIVEGYTFTCRHKGCEWKMEFAGACDDMECPTHEWKAWRTPKVKKVRWYDLRHSSATLHRLAGADRLAVKLLLGHGSDVDEIYLHMGADWVRRQLSFLSFNAGHQTGTTQSR
jgi:integrase